MAQADVVHIATHPSRVRIAGALAKTSGGLTVPELVVQVAPLPEAVIRFHLAILEQHELVEAQPETGNPFDEPHIAVRFSLTPKFREALEGAATLV